MINRVPSGHIVPDLRLSELIKFMRRKSRNVPMEHLSTSYTVVTHELSRWDIFVLGYKFPMKYAFLRNASIATDAWKNHKRKLSIGESGNWE